jgi:hypothetical protein
VPLLAGVALLALYALTLAPGVTFWDAGEFITAHATLGIPHPPGTPLYVLVGHLWTTALTPLFGVARASNLLSTACTASAGAIMCALLVRWTREPIASLAAVLCAGTMFSVWSNATETEVYAASLLLAICTLAAADRAGRSGDQRWLMLTAYLLALAVPLHLSALVVAPAAAMLAATRERDGETRFAWSAAALIGAVMLLALGVARWSISIVFAASAAILLVPSIVRVIRARSSRLAQVDAADDAELDMPRSMVSDARGTLPVLVLCFAAFSALLFLLLRARHDPLLNQGNPSTWAALGDVVARRQYSAAGIWPRQAPLWLQIGNLFEWADWQVALGLAPQVGPSLLRTPVTVLLAIVAVVGGAWHRRVDRRSWRALLTLALSASLGIAIYLNLKAGASYGVGVLPSDAPHEVRERDYFFELAFWCWGLWIGMGAWSISQRVLRDRRASAFAALLAPAIIVAGNWRAVTRRGEPDASLAAAVAEGTLASAPLNAVLILEADNDTYPLWFEQLVHRRRPDVTTVTVPLLGARWYRAELVRRHALLQPADTLAWRGLNATLASIGTGARRASRPLAIVDWAPAAWRSPLGSGWMSRGFVSVAAPHDAHSISGDSTPTAMGFEMVGDRLLVPSALLRPVRPMVDGVSRQMQDLMRCAVRRGSAMARPSAGRAERTATPSEVVPALLDSICNAR